MTEAVVDQRNTVLAEGFANPLNLPANAEAESHVKVYGDDELLTLGDDYTLDGVGDTGNLDEIDGVDVTIDQTILDADLYETFTVEHDPPLDQDAALSGGGRIGAPYEAALDAIARRLQVLGAKIGRALRLPTDLSEDDISVVLPHPVAGMALKWNSTGTALTNSVVDPDTGDADLSALAALVNPYVETALLSEINTAVAATDADKTATAASAAAAAASEAAAETAETNAEAAQAAAETQIVAASALAAPDDADLVAGVDVTDSSLAKTTWTQVKAFLKTYFDTLYSAVGHTHSFSSLTSKPTTLSGYGITNAINNDGDAGERYTYALCYTTNNQGNDFGDTRGGSGLRPCNSDDVPATGSTLSGTWECRGKTQSGGGDQVVTIWYRI